MKLFALIFLVLSTGCMSINEMAGKHYRDGRVEEKTSEFDNVKSVQMYQAWLSNLKFKVGAYKTSKMKPDEFVLEVELFGAVNIEKKDGLQLMIDGKVKKFSAIDKRTSISRSTASYVGPATNHVANYSTRKFLLNQSDLEALLAEGSGVRVFLLNGEYVEDSFAQIKDSKTMEMYSKANLFSAHDGLKEFKKVAFK